jgi:hypothetical protein
MKSSATSLVTFSGRIDGQPVRPQGPLHLGSVSHFCEVISSSVAETPSAGAVSSTFQEKLASGAAT